jgi:hypothetical protein
MAREPDDNESREEPSLGVPATLAPGPAEPHPVSVAEALSFAVDGPLAKRNLLAASAVLLVPVLGFFAVQGWAAETQHRLLQKHPSPTPRLGLRDLFHYAARGTTAGFVEALGAGVLTAVVSSLLAIANASLIAAGLASASLLVVLAVLLGLLLLGATLLGAVSVVFNAILTRAELTGRLSDAMAIGQAWRTFFAYLVFAPVAALLLAAGLALCGVGLLPALVIVKLAGAHLRWQLYEQRLHRGGAAIAALPPATLPSERAALRALPPASGAGR